MVDFDSSDFKFIIWTQHSRRCIQQKVDEVFSYLEVVMVITDDTFIYGDYDKSHDWNIANFLNRTRQQRLDTGLNKIHYKKTSI